MRIFRSWLLLLLATCSLPLAAEVQRRHAAHEHGEGRLDIAQEGTELHIEFESPAANIVGFEHAPRTTADHAALDRAVALLESGDRMFGFPHQAACQLVAADVTTPMSDHAAEEEHAHPEEGAMHGNEPPTDAGKQEHGDESHSDISAHYRFDCSHPEQLNQLTVKLFEAFPLTERLRVQIISETRQGAAEISGKQPIVRF